MWNENINVRYYLGVPVTNTMLSYLGIFYIVTLKLHRIGYFLISLVWFASVQQTYFKSSQL